MNVIITIISILAVSYIFTVIAKKARFPSVVALILSGLVLGYPAVRDIIIKPNSETVFVLGDAALLCLMFLAGYESSLKKLIEERYDAVMIAVFAALVPFAAGFAVMKMLGYSVLVSLVVGICMSITAEATKARLLLELKKIKTRVGSAMIGAGIIDDIIGFSLFILVTYLLKETFIKEDLLAGGAIIVFFLGILVRRNIGNSHPKMKITERILMWGVVPFFFISMGMHFDFNSLAINPSIVIIIIGIAMVGKLAGAFLTKPFTNFKWKQLYLIGWGMNSRGAVELALALIAFRTGLVPVELYSSLVIMALVTTMIFPFIITSIIKKDKKVMG